MAISGTPVSGKAAIITGSTSGIGLGIAESLAAAGANLVLNGFGDAATIEATRARLASEHGVEVLYNGADMTRPDEIVALAEVCTTAFGGVDVLVNNAGIQYTAAIEDFPVEKWDAIMAINLSAVFHTTRAVLPGMRTRGTGRIINIASAHGRVASPFKSAYVAAKHGVVGLTKVTALETARTGITCNAICPGWVLTPLVERQIADRAAAEGISEEAAVEALLGEKQPSMAFATTAQIGGLVLYLCSDSAAEIRGQALGIDGGWTAR